MPKPLVEPLVGAPCRQIDKVREEVRDKVLCPQGRRSTAKSVNGSRRLRRERCRADPILNLHAFH